MRIRTLPTILVLAILAFAAGPVTAAPRTAGRVSLIRGEALLQGARDDEQTTTDGSEWSYLDRNLTVVAGDLIWLAPNAVLELELPNGVALRAGPDARFEIASLDPEPDVRIAAGPVYLCSRSGYRAPAVRAFTPGARIELPRRASVRIDVTPLGTTRITGRSGYVDYEAGKESGFLSTDERVYVEPGLRASRSVYAGPEDEFDAWVREACLGVALEGLDQVGAGSLSEHGTWRTVGGLRVWSPHVGPEWRPYDNGAWQWLPGHGWTWVPRETWGWTTHHYGAWSFASGIGWVWLPGSDWHGGRVLWLRDMDGPAWVPLGPDGEPVIIHAGRSVRVGRRSVDPRTVCRGRRADESTGEIHTRDHGDGTPATVVTSQPSLFPGHAPAGAFVRGGRRQDADLGAARERARTIARRARDLRARPEREASHWSVRLPQDGAGRAPGWGTAAPSTDRGAAAAREDEAFGRTPDGTGWRPAPAVLPEAGVLHTTDSWGRAAESPSAIRTPGQRNSVPATGVPLPDGSTPVPQRQGFSEATGGQPVVPQGSGTGAKDDSEATRSKKRNGFTGKKEPETSRKEDTGDAGSATPER